MVESPNIDCPFRVGNGYDIHRLESGIPLFLGGIEIEFDRGLAGHSDGDVLTHAIIDALLGAAGLGDIGQHFPPGDASIKGIRSLAMLEKTVALLEEHSFAIGNIDATVVCEKPRLSDHYQAMKASLAGAASVGTDSISLKAKTAERMGEVGRGEAIEAYAVALLVRRRD